MLRALLPRDRDEAMVWFPAVVLLVVGGLCWAGAVYWHSTGLAVIGSVAAVNGLIGTLLPIAMR